MGVGHGQHLPRCYSFTQGGTQSLARTGTRLLAQIHHRDTWGQGAVSYLQMMWERLSLMHALLKDRGAIYVHCDWHMNSGLRLLLDQLFGAQRFG